MAGAVLALLLAGVAIAATSASISYSINPVWLGNPSIPDPNTPTPVPEATPQFSNPFDDSDAVTAVSSDGAATAAWIDTGDELAVSSLDTTSGQWSTGLELGAGQTTNLPGGVGGRQYSPAVAMDAAGDAVVAWWTGSDVDYSYELGGGASPTWSPAASLGVTDGGAVYDIQIAMNSSGDAAIAVGYNDGSAVELTTGNAADDFVFGTPVAIGQPSGGTSADLPQVAIDSAGDVLTAWVESGPGSPTPYASFEAAGSSTPSAATAVSASADAELGNGGMTLAMNDSGEAAIAWSDGSSPSELQETDANLAQLKTTGGPQFDASTTVSPDASEGDEVFPSIALSDDGATALVWNDGNPDEESDAIIRPASDFGTSTWTDTTDLEANSAVCPPATSPPGGPCANQNVTTAPQVTFEQGDNAVVLWGGSDDGIYSVMSQGDSFAGLSASSVSTLEYGTSNSTTGDNPAPGAPLSLAGDGVGDAVATWIMASGGADQAATDEMDGAGTSFGIQATATVNTPYTVTASTPWTWNNPSTNWDFGDGSTGSGSPDSHVYTNTTATTYTVSGDTSDGSGASNDATATISALEPQSITNFSVPTSGTVGVSGSLSATPGASGVPVVFSVDSSSSPSDACSVSGTNGSTVHFAHVGSCVIDANEPGNSDYAAAPQQSQPITVAQGSQSISFPAPGAGTDGGSESLSATGGASGNPVVFSVDSSSSPSDACSVSGTNGSTVHFAHAGSCVIDANQAGNSDYSNAPQVADTITVPQDSQTISFPAPGAGTEGGSESLSATGGASGNPVVFSVASSSSPSDACSVSGTNGSTVTFAHAGSCAIDANQAGNSDYSAAAPVSHSIAVSSAAVTTTNTTAAATPTTTTATPTTTATASTPPPVLGQSSDVSKTSGTVQVELPGTHTFVTVSASEQIPFGAVINATNGKVTATIALPGGATSTATFWAGEFTLSQSSSGALTAKLVDGSSAGCPTSEKASKHSSRLRTGHDLTLAKATKKKPGAVVGSLWTNAKGSYTTSGKNGSAAVLGTEWLTRDQCDGTFFEVVKTSNDPHGEIRVTVLHPHKHTVLLKRGHSLLAPAPGFP